jgi:hypothetical protein
MTYQLDIDKISDRLLAEAEIKSAIEQPPAFLNDAYVRSELRKRIASIRGEAANDIETLEAVEREVGRAHAEFNRQTTTPGSVDTSKFTAGCLPLIGGIALAIWFGADAATRLSVKWVEVIAEFVGFIIILALARIYFFYHKLPKIRAAVTGPYQLDTAADRLQAARLVADEAVGRAARRAAVTLINEAQKPFYQSRLFVFRSPAETPSLGQRKTVGIGLSEVLSPANEVATETRSKIVQMIESLPGASIGISGPRGVGKSTLLLSLCSARPSSSDDTSVRVYTTAPVEHESRDFLLHIYACVCRAVLKIRQAEDERGFARGRRKFGSRNRARNCQEPTPRRHHSDKHRRGSYLA